MALKIIKLFLLALKVIYQSHTNSARGQQSLCYRFGSKMSRSTVAIDTIVMDLLEKAWVKEGNIYNKEYGTHINMCRLQSAINQLRTPQCLEKTKLCSSQSICC